MTYFLKLSTLSSPKHTWVSELRFGVNKCWLITRAERYYRCFVCYGCWRPVRCGLVVRCAEMESLIRCLSLRNFVAWSADRSASKTERCERCDSLRLTRAQKLTVSQLNLQPTAKQNISEREKRNRWARNVNCFNYTFDLYYSMRCVIVPLNQYDDDDN